MRMQVILDSSFARPGSAPIWGGKKGEFRDWTMNALNSNIECDDSFAVSFADLQREFYKFHSLLGSVGELSGDKL